MTLSLGASRRRPAGWSGPALLNGLNAFDQLGELGAVLVPHRLDRILEWFLVVELDDLDASRFRLSERFLLVIRPEHAFFLLRLTTELRQQTLIILRQAVPGLAREYQHLGYEQ